MAYAQTHGATSNAPAGPINLGVIYTCPMHPQIRQTRLGNCPICGMPLE
jgi:Cu+-exporting ATPase